MERYAGALADSAAGLTEAAARRDLKPAEFGRSVDAHVDRAAAGVRRLDDALRRLVSEHAV